MKIITDKGSIFLNPFTLMLKFKRLVTLFIEVRLGYFFPNFASFRNLYNSTGITAKLLFHTQTMVKCRSNKGQMKAKKVKWCLSHKRFYTRVHWYHLIDLKKKTRKNNSNGHSSTKVSIFKFVLHKWIRVSIQTF